MPADPQTRSAGGYHPDGASQSPARTTIVAGTRRTAGATDRGTDMTSDVSTTTPTDQDVVDAYLYLFGRLLVARQEHHDIEVERVGWNRIKYNPVGSAEFVNPNLDVAYLEAWIAVDRDHAVLLEVPEIHGRYFTVQVMDVWGEVIVNVNERNFPDHPSGTVAFRLAGTDPIIDDSALVVDLPGPKAKILARVELQDTPDEAVALQRRFRIDAPAGIDIAPPPAVPEFTNAELPGVEAFRVGPALLETAPDAMPDAPRYVALVSAVADFAASGPDAAEHVDRVIRTQAWPAFLAGTKGFGTQRNGWSVAFAAGRFGNDVLARDIVDYGGLWANVVDEAIYYVGQLGDDGALLDGSRTYEVRFAPGEPDALVDAFWSLTLYSVPDYRVVPNDLERYDVNSEASFVRNDDGSTSIWLAPERPSDAGEPNWLPTPAGRGFSLNLRLYVARRPALDGTWFPPPIAAVDAR
ncbi:DUF1254 domain-containing protein [Curtobacterium sp. MCLR17_055]|nr:DUF1254 domain-containing protein [Curtobacterium sp. MCLR17_055]